MTHVEFSIRTEHLKHGAPRYKQLVGQRRCLFAQVFDTQHQQIPTLQESLAEGQHLAQTIGNVRFLLEMQMLFLD